MRIVVVTLAVCGFVATASARTNAEMCQGTKAYKDALMCSLLSIRSFAQQVSEPAQTIAQGAYDQCNWGYAWQSQGWIMKDNENQEVYRQKRIRELVVIVLESRLPDGEKRPNTESKYTVATVQIPDCP